MKIGVAIFGSTGSIGVNSLDVISRLGSRFKVTALSAESNIELLARQAKKFRPKLVCVGDERLAEAIKPRLPRGTVVLCGPDGLKVISSGPEIDIALFAIAGSACLAPLVNAIKNKKRIALANKEALVSAGPLVMRLVAENGVKIVPIDSEHSAIFQCVDGRAHDISRIYLTGSGGPLLNVPGARFDTLPRSRILNHPKWKMGKKISVDSATMMNKGLEIIEAKYLFGLSEERIEVLIHPEAIVHSMVEFVDGAVLAELGVPDMRLPIQYALTYPDRMPCPVGRVNFSASGGLTFRAPDVRKFPCLGIARDAAASGGTAPAVLCASDEEAVRCYLDRRIKFSDIPRTIEKVLSKHKNNGNSNLTVARVLEAGLWAREETRAICCH
jgi:1-deoxy-D-xylulose-5-phosphate reductoisomerase